MTSHNKKRKYQEEIRNVKSEWEEDFAHISKNGKALCHSCNAPLCHYQVNNLKRHYGKKHESFRPNSPQIRIM
jgi:hypothetical protein